MTSTGLLWLHRASTLGVSIYVFLRVHNLNMLVFDLLSSSAQ